MSGVQTAARCFLFVLATVIQGDVWNYMYTSEYLTMKTITVHYGYNDTLITYASLDYIKGKYMLKRRQDGMSSVDLCKVLFSCRNRPETCHFQTI